MRINRVTVEERPGSRASIVKDKLPAIPRDLRMFSGHFSARQRQVIGTTAADPERALVDLDRLLLPGWARELELSLFLEFHGLSVHTRAVIRGAIQAQRPGGATLVRISRRKVD